MTKRDLGQELLDSIQAIQKGQGRRISIKTPGDVKTVRKQLHLNQTDFATLLGVSHRTLQEWEQGRRQPSGPALSLLTIAEKHPKIFKGLYS